MTGMLAGQQALKRAGRAAVQAPVNYSGTGMGARAPQQPGGMMGQRPMGAAMPPRPMGAAPGSAPGAPRPMMPNVQARQLPGMQALGGAQRPMTPQGQRVTGQMQQSIQAPNPHRLAPGEEVQGPHPLKPGEQVNGLHPLKPGEQTPTAAENVQTVVDAGKEAAGQAGLPTGLDINALMKNFSFDKIMEMLGLKAPSAGGGAAGGGGGAAGAVPNNTGTGPQPAPGEPGSGPGAGGGVGESYPSEFADDARDAEDARQPQGGFGLRRRNTYAQQAEQPQDKATTQALPGAGGLSVVGTTPAPGTLQKHDADAQKVTGELQKQGSGEVVTRDKFGNIIVDPDEATTGKHSSDIPAPDDPVSTVTDQMSENDIGRYKKFFGQFNDRNKEANDLLRSQVGGYDDASKFGPQAEEAARQQMMAGVNMDKDASMRDLYDRQARGGVNGTGAATGIASTAANAIASGERGLKQDAYGRELSRLQGRGNAAGALGDSLTGGNMQDYEGELGNFTSNKEFVSMLMKMFPDILDSFTPGT